MIEVSDDIQAIALVWAVVLILCFCAPLVDLGCGIAKARQRHERITSFGLHRTVIKIITYTGSVFLAGCIDVLMHMAHVWHIAGVDMLVNVPVVSVLMGMFNVFVEMVSVRERADRKADKRAKAQLIHIIETLRSQEVTQLLQHMGAIKREAKEVTDEDTH